MRDFQAKRLGPSKLKRKRKTRKRNKKRRTWRGLLPFCLFSYSGRFALTILLLLLLFHLAEIRLRRRSSLPPSLVPPVSPLSREGGGEGNPFTPFIFLPSPPSSSLYLFSHFLTAPPLGSRDPSPPLPSHRTRQWGREEWHQRKRKDCRSEKRGERASLGGGKKRALHSHLNRGIKGSNLVKIPRGNHCPLVSILCYFRTLLGDTFQCNREFHLFQIMPPPPCSPLPLLLLLLLLPPSSSPSSSSSAQPPAPPPPPPEKLSAVVPGDVMLGGLFPMHEYNLSRKEMPCGAIKEEKGIQVSGREKQLLSFCFVQHNARLNPSCILSVFSRGVSPSAPPENRICMLDAAVLWAEGRREEGRNSFSFCSSHVLYSVECMGDALGGLWAPKRCAEEREARRRRRRNGIWNVGEGDGFSERSFSPRQTREE